MRKKALIFGISGQAGRHLYSLLESRGYEVWGTMTYLDGQSARLRMVDFMQPEKIDTVIWESKPDEVYNLAALMYAPASWKKPFDYTMVNGVAVIKMLESIQKHCPKAKFFQASSAEVFGPKSTLPQDEKTKRNPSNPYAIAKQLADDTVRIWRDKGVFACSGILFNMESMLRPNTFFVQKVIRAAAKGERLVLGPLNAVRDWGLTKEYVHVMWQMLQSPRPTDYVIGTGEPHSCQEFVEEAYRQAGYDWKLYVQHADDNQDQTVMAPYPVLAKVMLGWEAKTKFKDVIAHLLAEVKAEVLVG